MKLSISPLIRSLDKIKQNQRAVDHAPWGNIVLALPLALSTCLGSDPTGHPTIQGPGYVMTVCETGVGLGGNMKKAMVSAYVRWGCGKGGK